MRPKRLLPLNRTITLELQAQGFFDKYKKIRNTPLSLHQKEILDRRVLTIIKEVAPTQAGGCQHCDIYYDDRIMDYKGFDIFEKDISTSLSRLKKAGKIVSTKYNRWVVV